MIFTFTNANWPKARIGAIVRDGKVIAVENSISYMKDMPVGKLMRWGLMRADTIEIKYTMTESQIQAHDRKYVDRRLEEIEKQQKLLGITPKQDESEFKDYGGWSSGS